MALTLDYRQVKPIFRGSEFVDSVKMNAPVDPGTVVSPAADGRYGPGSGGGMGVALTRALSANQNVSVLRQDELDLGDSIQGLAPGQPVYALADGTLTDAATEADGTTAATEVGTIIPVRGGPAGATNANGARMLLRLNL